MAIDDVARDLIDLLTNKSNTAASDSIESAIVAIAGGTSVQTVLAVDAGGTVTATPTSFLAGNFTPSRATGDLLVQVNGTTVTQAAEITVLIGATRLKLGRIFQVGGVSRMVRLTGLTPGVAVTFAVEYKMAGAGTFICNPATACDSAVVTFFDAQS